jgi:hypothetical protein
VSRRRRPALGEIPLSDAVRAAEARADATALEALLAEAAVAGPVGHWLGPFSPGQP